MYNYNLGLLFYKIADQHRDKAALVFDENRTVSFDELNRLSNIYAGYLLDKGISAGKVIGIFHSKRIESYALMLACLKTGAVYVNLDNKSPVERLKKIIDRCLPVLIAVDNSNDLELAGNFSVPFAFLASNEFASKVEGYSSENLQFTSSVCSDNPAYIMFTSGSTGFPKGAVMTHQNLLNFISWTNQTYKITRDDILSNVNPMYFDNSVFDFYASLFNGAAMAPIESETVQQAAKLVARIDKVGTTIWFSVPSLLVYLITMKVLNQAVFKKIRIITFGGEGFPKTKLKILYDHFKDRIRIVNVYGPTECSCICSAYDISEKDFSDIKNLAPLGFLSPNFKYKIIDDDSKESDSGELLLGGPQVGLGYYNDPERTNQSFIQNPFGNLYRDIYYRTGDLVRKDKNGILHILGRSDNQIKHMGYRIELEEIEAGINSLEYVNESGVVYKKFDDGLGQINAFISLHNAVTVDIVRSDLKKILPAYMQPRIITYLDVLPKNQNGKIDRLALKNLI